jgi:chromosome segregation ATPase
VEKELFKLQAELDELRRQRDSVESDWIEASEELEFLSQQAGELD